MSGSDDVAYSPSVEGTWTDLGAVVDTCLVLGDPPLALLHKASAEGIDVRIGEGARWSRVLHRGSYTIREDGRASVLVVLQGLPPEAASAGRQRHLGNHLGTAGPVLQAEMVGARAARTEAGVVEGDLVRVRSTGQLATVVSVRGRMGEFEAVVEGAFGRQGMDVSGLEVVDGDPRDPGFWITQAPSTADEMSLTVTWTKLRHPLTDTVYSYNSSKTIFRAYQFAPVLKVVGASSGRLLVADEVGLGKTIEAGLIWSELEQRRPLDRVLVVAPASLGLKWRSEMGHRFDRELSLLKPSDLLAHAEDMRAGRDVRFSGVVSVESLRVADAALEALSEVHASLDLVVVDEAHVLRNRGTRAHDLGQLLSDWADVLVFLSATPLNLGRSDLFNLVNLLRADEFADEAVFAAQLEPNQVLNQVVRRIRAERGEPRKLLTLARSISDMELGAAVTARPDFQQMCRVLDSDEPLDLEQVARVKRAAASLNTLGSVLTRTRKVDVPDAKARRSAHQVDVVWTDHERRMYDAIRALYMADFARRGTPPGFGMQMPLRQAASCLPAMQEVLRTRHFTDTHDSEEPDAVSDEGGARDASGSGGAELPSALLGREDLLSTMPVDSKYEAMEEKLLDLRGRDLRQVMVFSYFRRTIAYLHERLSQVTSVRMMHGGVPMEQRQRIMQDFREGKFDVLILSQVGAEGLDFEFCNVMVNYDLPWNPMQVEQRIGRLDRFGQEHERIYIFNMHVPGTIESDIFERLYQRIGVFTESIGELEPILRDRLQEVTRTLLDPKLSEEERRDEADRVAVALAEQAEQLQALESARGVLSTVDLLQVDGMTDDGPTDGRFVGPTEVRRLVEKLLALHGGSLSQPNRHTGICRLVGSEQLAQAVRTSGVTGTGSMRSVLALAASLRDGTTLRVTFDSDMASKHQVELISGRHPLAEVAVRALEQSDVALARFGVVSLPGVPEVGNGCAARLDLASASGLTPRLELWVTAVDLETGVEVPDLGGRVLDAVAHGRLADAEAVAHPAWPRLLPLLDDAVSARRRRTQSDWRADNEARVDARVASRLRSVDLKVQRARRTMEEVVARGRDERVRRLHEGRIKNLLADREAVESEVVATRVLDVSTSTIALLQVHAG